MDGAVRNFLVHHVHCALKNAAGHPSLDQIAAPVLVALATSAQPGGLAQPEHEDEDMRPQGSAAEIDELSVLRNTWMATAQIVLFTVKADRLGLTRLNGPSQVGHQALLWGVFDFPPRT